MLLDCHLHLENRTEDGKGPHFQNPEDYIKAGKERGVEVFGFSDHAYAFLEAQNINFNDWQRVRCKYEIREYLDILKKLKEKHKNILIGLEIDYAPEKEIEIEKFINSAQKDFDFFIGSVHWIGDWGFDLDAQEYQNEIKKRGTEKVFENYFSVVQKAIESKLFDVMGHIDLIKIFGAVPQNKKYIQEIVAILKKFDQAIEINTNGKNKPIAEFYPGIDFLEECFRQEIRITLGSDAHSPDRTGEYFDEAKKIILDIGYRELVYFEKRKLKTIKIG